MDVDEGTRIQERFAAVVDVFRGEPDVGLPGDGKGFGSSGLRVRGKVFAMLSSLKPSSKIAWLLLAREAVAWVGGARGSPRQPETPRQ